MSSLHETIAMLAQDGEDYRIEAPELWAQGRTLFGGMTAALSHGAIGRAYGDLGPLRSAQFSFIGPASGQLRFRPELLRRGRSSAVVGVDCWNEEGLAARSTFFFGAARESAVTHDYMKRLDVPPPEECEPFTRTSKPLTGFLARFETRLAAGSRILQPGNKPEFAVWARLRDGEGGDPVTALLAFADCLPCAAWVDFPKPAPVSTMSWTVDFHHPLPPSRGWHLIWSSSEAAAEGYSLQDMRVYNAAGEPLIAARQAVAIFA
ncbi:MAG TPA: thioesterase family protein [Sphingobium sp.]|uniref:thioesterase family protein n=1 Tax=Sphingobium sp. TaxID=1912891 RepID=UPI002ED28071